MVDNNETLIVEESNSIGMRNERSLHSELKKWYALPGDKFEVRVDGFIIDIVRGDQLIEIQTRNFYAMKKKLEKLIKNHQVHLIYPIPKEKLIIRISELGEIISKRKSPKKGKPIDLFDELLRIPKIINEKNFTLEILMVLEEEIRCEDGKGSWRRKGVSIKDHKLVEVLETIKFNKKEDFYKLLPGDLVQPFTNKILAERMKIPVRKARKITYCLKKMGMITELGKSGRELLYELA
ncbi:MAG: hypothetical protein KAX49_06135 [Halanaerobiales bacterium]|nr:hypothetical protein [Halanaerobiales bacterium]